MNGMPHATLLTGATGFVGMELLAQLVEADDRPVYTLIRAADQGAADARLATVRQAVFGDPQAHAERIFAVPGDLERSRLGLSATRRRALAASVSEVVHGAASVSFADPLPVARAVNVEGTRRVLDLCAELDGLRRVVHVSTAYVAGRHRNSYEQSKAEAEDLALGAGLPLAVARPSIVVGHSASGWTSSFNVLYGPLRAFAAGTLTVIPGRRSAPVDVVPVDHVARGVLRLLRGEGMEGRVGQLTAGEGVSTVGEVCALGAAAFARVEPCVLWPRVYRRAVHPVLLRTGPAARRRAVRRGEVYLPYFALRERFAACDDLISAPPLAAYFDALCGFAVEARWGRRTITRAQAARLASFGADSRQAA